MWRLLTACLFALLFLLFLLPLLVVVFVSGGGGARGFPVLVFTVGGFAVSGSTVWLPAWFLSACFFADFFPLPEEPRTANGLLLEEEPPCLSEEGGTGLRATPA